MYFVLEGENNIFYVVDSNNNSYGKYDSFREAEIVSQNLNNKIISSGKYPESPAISYQNSHKFSNSPRVKKVIKKQFIVQPVNSHPNTSNNNLAQNQSVMMNPMNNQMPMMNNQMPMMNNQMPMMNNQMPMNQSYNAGMSFNQNHNPYNSVYDFNNYPQYSPNSNVPQFQNMMPHFYRPNIPQQSDMQIYDQEIKRNDLLSKQLSKELEKKDEIIRSLEDNYNRLIKEQEEVLKSNKQLEKLDDIESKIIDINKTKFDIESQVTQTIDLIKNLEKITNDLAKKTEKNSESIKDISSVKSAPIAMPTIQPTIQSTSQPTPTTVSVMPILPASPVVTSPSPKPTALAAAKQPMPATVANNQMIVPQAQSSAPATQSDSVASHIPGHLPATMSKARLSMDDDLVITRDDMEKFLSEIESD